MTILTLPFSSNWCFACFRLFHGVCRVVVYNDIFLSFLFVFGKKCPFYKTRFYFDFVKSNKVECFYFILIEVVKPSKHAISKSVHRQTLKCF